MARRVPGRIVVGLFAWALCGACAERGLEPPAALPEPADFLAQAREYIAASEYWASPSGEGLQAPNRRHRLRTWFEPAGIRVHDRTASGSPRLLALRLARVGRGEALAAVAPGEVESHEGRVEIRREGVLEWYLNAPEGLEQGFTFERRPAPDARGELVLELAVEGARADARGDEVAFASAAGRTLRYGALAAHDAAGRALASRFEVAAADRVRLVVDDAAARYPIVIDPLLTETADALLEADQADANFGFSVASAGDVNGDGYADVIVGAPGYDNGHSDEGAAFVRYGSPTGLGPAVTQLESNRAGANFGRSVASAGDVNGDGYGDVIVGAHRYGTPQVQFGEGAAFVFLGSAGGIVGTNPLDAHARFEGEQDDAQLGISVASAGDVNGDGYGDVIVGANLYDAGQTDEGAAFVFLGSAAGIADGTPATAHARLESNQQGAELGRSVSSAGDVNGDGYADVLIGAYLYDRTAASLNQNHGAAFAFLGSASGIADGNPSTAHARFINDQSFAQFGSAVASAGDVNADGYGDIVIGAEFFDAGASDEGAAFVFLGGASGLADGDPGTAHAQLEANLVVASFGASVAGAGDVNGDGYADVIVGASRFSSGATQSGATFVFLGSAAGIPDGNGATAYAYLRANQAGSRMGFSVAVAGDVNGDGYDDVIVGAHLHNAGQEDEGVAFVYHGGGAGIRDGNPATANALLESDQDFVLGTNAASAGDVNGDGYTDVIVGAPFYDAGLAEGAAFVFLGSAAGVVGTNPVTAHARLLGSQILASMGDSVASAGDVNGDGYDDVIVGADGIGGTAGAAYVFLGSASGIADATAATAHAQLVSDQSNAFMGRSVASAGDVNGDGYSDVIIGAPNYDTGGPSSLGDGAAFVFLGSAEGIADGDPSTAHARLESDQTNSFMGESVASAGDVNGDGYADVIVGAQQYALHDGRAFVFLGSPAGIADGNPSTAHTRLFSSNIGARLGTSVASAGDVNGDGYSDVIVGAADYDAGQTEEGAAFVFLGSASGIPDTGSSSAHARLESDQEDAGFGLSVAGAGDVNGDGYADVIVGAPGYEVGPTAEGAAFVFLGSAEGIANGNPATAHARIESDQVDATFARAVSAAGDVNGDGYGDVVVSSYRYDHGQQNEGAAFVFHGNSDGRPVLARQRRGDGSGIPVAPWGASQSQDGFAVELLAHHPAGQGRVRLEVEVCGTGVAFGDASCTTALGAWTAVGSVTPVLLSHTLTGLDAGTLHRWRARVLRAPATGPLPANPARGPWRRLAGQAHEADIRSSLLAVCGDGVLHPLLGESCDDGNTDGGDGCSASCWIEAGSLPLYGTAMGGSVSLTVDGVAIAVQTEAGQTADEVLAAVAAAIEAHPSLEGVSTAVVGGVLYTSGSATAPAVSDLGLGVVPSPAVTVAYSERASFEAAIAGVPATVESFESLADQQLVTSLGGVTYSTQAPVESPMATSAFDTPSGVISLGLDNADEAFVDGDALALTLASPSSFAGLYVITSDPAEAGEIALVTPVGAAWNRATPDAVLPDGGLVYFLGLVSDTSFQDVAIGFAPQDGHFVYTVDEIYLPEPGAWGSLVSGAVLLAGLHRRRNPRRGRRDE